jgi:CBS domain-containing protein
MSANAGPATATGLTVGDVIRAQLYRVPSTATIGAAAEEFVRRDVERVIVESDDGQISPATQTAMKALATMLADNERRVLVEDENGLAGIATQRDLTRTILLQLRVDTS